MGLDLFPRTVEFASPTVTVVKVPERVQWPELNRRFRERGLVVGGAFGPLANRVFRIGHMGAQADNDLVDRGLEAIRQSLSF